ncbi:MAG: NAD(P)-dependent oxidoreductase [Pseudomonadota bacterium]
MKIGYLLRVRPDLEDIIPDDVEGVRIEVGEDGLYAAEDLEKIRDVDAFVIGMEPVNEQILAAADNLKIVQRLGVGYETLDLEACAKRQIPACNIEGVNKEAVAEHSMMFILSLSKHLLEAQAHTQNADWFSARKLTSSAFEVKDKKLGIIGFGNTGSSLAKRAKAFEMEILYNDLRDDINADLAAELGARKVDKATLFAESDFVNIATDLNEHSRGMINAEALAQMQPHARLVCCARGGVIDEDALADALKNGTIAAAAIDVFEIEPVRQDNPLLGLPNCMVTAHVAGVVHESTMRIWDWAHENVRRVVQRGERANWIRNGV